MIVQPDWQEKDHVITLTVTSDGTTGSEWITRFKEAGISVKDEAKNLLKASHFNDNVTNDTTYSIAVLKGLGFPSDELNLYQMRRQQQRQDFASPNPEVACLLLDRFRETGFAGMGIAWIMVMSTPWRPEHLPPDMSRHLDPQILYICDGSKRGFNPHLGALPANRKDGFNVNVGFAFQKP